MLRGLYAIFIFAGGLQSNIPMHISPPSVAFLRSLCGVTTKIASHSKVSILGLKLPTGEAGVLKMDFLGGDMPTRADVLAAQPSRSGGKRRKNGGAGDKRKRAKLVKPLPLAWGAEAAGDGGSSADEGLSYGCWHLFNLLLMLLLAQKK